MTVFVSNYEWLPWRLLPVDAAPGQRLDVPALVPMDGEMD